MFFELNGENLLDKKPKAPYYECRTLEGRDTMKGTHEHERSRSVRQTRQSLSLALIQLLNEKPLQAITVRELTRKAGVSRGTFYFHYCDIYDLLEQLEQEQLDQLARLMDALLPRLNDETPPEALRLLYEYLDENDDVCRALLGEHSTGEFILRLEQSAAERWLAFYAAQGVPVDRRRYRIAFAVHGCLGCVAAWLRMDKTVPIAEMAELTWQSIRAVQLTP